MQSLLEARNLTKSYPTGSGQRLLVLDELDLQVNRGEMLAIVGESGTGKSTLLHILGGLSRPDAGSITFDGTEITELPDTELARFRNRSVGFVFQFHHLLPEFSALENVAMPALIRGSSIDDVRGDAMERLARLGLEDRASHRPAMLSGGEQQRVAVARALMNNPPLVLADEPTGNLDTSTAEKLHEEFEMLGREFGQTFVIATHNPALANRADRILRLADHKLRPESDLAAG